MIPACCSSQVRPPPELDELYDELRSLELHTPPLRATSDLSLKVHSTICTACKVRSLSIPDQKSSRTTPYRTTPFPAILNFSLLRQDLRRGLDHSMHETEKTAQPNAEPEGHPHSVHGGGAAGTKLAAGASTGKLNTS